MIKLLMHYDFGSSSYFNDDLALTFPFSAKEEKQEEIAGTRYSKPKSYFNDDSEEVH